jgi:hypothetical protein
VFPAVAVILAGMSGFTISEVCQKNADSLILQELFLANSRLSID